MPPAKEPRTGFSGPLPGKKKEGRNGHEANSRKASVEIEGAPCFRTAFSLLLDEVPVQIRSCSAADDKD